MPGAPRPGKLANMVAQAHIRLAAAAANDLVELLKHVHGVGSGLCERRLRR